MATEVQCHNCGAIADHMVGGLHLCAKCFEEWWDEVGGKRGLYPRTKEYRRLPKKVRDMIRFQRYLLRTRGSDDR